VTAMGEAHTKGTLSWRPVAPEGGSGQSAMARASNGQPFKPYVYGGGDKEPAAVTAARQRHRALNAALVERLRELEATRVEVMPDPEPGYEWQRELDTP